jgi:hypothetical protein
MMIIVFTAKLLTNRVITVIMTTMDWKIKSLRVKNYISMDNSLGLY